MPESNKQCHSRNHRQYCPVLSFRIPAQEVYKGLPISSLNISTPRISPTHYTPCLFWMCNAVIFSYPMAFARMSSINSMYLKSEAFSICCFSNRLHPSGNTAGLVRKSGTYAWSLLIIDSTVTICHAKYWLSRY